MTLSDTATAQPWEAFRAGGGASLVREAVELVLQELIEAEAAEVIGAGRNERTDARVTVRNGLVCPGETQSVRSFESGGADSTMRRSSNRSDQGLCLP